MNIGSSYQLRQLELNRVFASAPQASTGNVSTDDVTLSEAAQKAKLVEGMIRVSPGREADQKLVDSLSFLPLEVLSRISEYGTRYEMYDKDAPDLPLYAQHLKKPNLDGAYSPTANVVFIDKDNITPRILVHESLHALDMATGQPSSKSPWTEARDISRQTRRSIRPYATHNSAEYFADNLAASLFTQESLARVLAHDLSHHIGTEGISKEELVANHAHYHREGQAQSDQLASKLCEKFWRVLPRYPRAAPRPALTPQEYKTKLKELYLQRKNPS